MSNHLAIATVTASLRRMLQGVVAADVSGAAVTTVRPTESGAGLPQTGVNIFLYQVVPNPDLRNLDLPTRRSDGSVLQRPVAALDLFYLFSFYGDQSTLESQRLLGAVVRTLHARPLLTREMIRETLADPAFAFLAGSDLDGEAELVRLTPLGYQLQEMSQLWSGLFQKTDYALSLAFRASVVLLTAEERPKPALPVRLPPQILVQSVRHPLLDTAMAEEGPGAPLVVGANVRLAGQRLLAPLVRVRVAGRDIEPSEVTDTAILFTLGEPGLDPAALRAGVIGVQVLHPFLVGSPQEPRPGVESNVLPLVLRPRVLSVAVASPTLEGGRVKTMLTLHVEPPLGAGQRAALHLNSLPGTAEETGPSSYSFPVPVRNADTAQFKVPVSGVVPGAYLYRLQVDGAESPLSVDGDPASETFGRFDGPSVQIGGGG
jgi:hypothetical protein